MKTSLEIINNLFDQNLISSEEVLIILRDINKNSKSSIYDSKLPDHRFIPPTHTPSTTLPFYMDHVGNSIFHLTN